MGNPTTAKQRIWKIQALTDIWTGDADRRGDRLITTGLVGSIRWWFEVLVRGLGGSACDPSDPGNRCPQDSRKKSTDHSHHCVVCELFGCTGWARKFRFQVLNESGNVKQHQIKEGRTVKFVFTELRPMREEEWALLDLTLRLIAEYGAIGGRTVFKPSDEQGRQGLTHHKDFGLIEIQSIDPAIPGYTEDQLRQYVTQSRWRRVDRDDFAWASLQNFWCVKGRYLARQNANNSTFNQVIGREEPKNRGQLLKANATNVDRWLAGRQQESKKVFSFKDPEKARRTFGFVKPGLINLDSMKDRLKGIWSNLANDDFLKGEEILEALLDSSGGGAP